MDKKPKWRQRRSQYLVMRVDYEVDAETSANVHEPTSPFTWDWTTLDYSPVTDSSPTVLVYGIFHGERVPDRDEPRIHWHRPHGHDF